MKGILSLLARVVAHRTGRVHWLDLGEPLGRTLGKGERRRGAAAEALNGRGAGAGKGFLGLVLDVGFLGEPPPPIAKPAPGTPADGPAEGTTGGPTADAPTPN